MISACATGIYSCSTPAASTITTNLTSPVRSRQRTVYAGAACGPRGGAGGSNSRHRQVRPETTGITRTKPRCARLPKGWSSSGYEGKAARTDQVGSVPAVFRPSYRTLAGSGRARCGRLQGRRRMARARARHDAHVEPGIYIRPSPRTQGILEHRHPHRGRSAGDLARSGGADAALEKTPDAIEALVR